LDTWEGEEKERTDISLRMGGGNKDYSRKDGRLGRQSKRAELEALQAEDERIGEEAECQ